MAEEKKQVKFKVGDRVIDAYGYKGTITQFTLNELTVVVEWDYGGRGTLARVSTLKLIGEEERR